MDLTKERMPLGLQFFAEETVETATGQSASQPTDESADVGKEERAPESLTTLLAGDKGLQSQFDKLVSKALATAQAKWEKEKSMTAEELAQTKAQEKAQELALREGELRTRELRAEALETLGEKGIPAELISCVSLTDSETMKDSLLKAESAFRRAVDRAVREKLAGVVPRGNGNPEAAYMAQFRAAAGIKSR